MERSREHKLVDIMFDVALTINSRQDFFAGKSNEEICKWVGNQLRMCGFDTSLVGSSWGVLFDLRRNK